MEALFLSAQREKESQQVLLVLTGHSSLRKTDLARSLGEVLQWPLIDVNALHYGFEEFFPFDTAKPRHEYMEGYYEAMKWLAWTQLRIKLNVIISAPFIDKDDFDKLAGVEDIFSCRLIFIDVDQLSDLDSIRKEKDVSTIRRFIESYVPDPLNIARNLQEPPPDGEPLLRICAGLDNEELELGNPVESEFKCHDQKLQLESRYIGQECSACGVYIFRRAYQCWQNPLRCRSCIHVKCARLPRSVYHEYHNYCDQPLTLTFTPEDDDPDNLYCEVCEEKRGQCQWFYYCSKCDFAAHLSCPTPEERGYYTTNYLRWCRWEGRNVH